MIRSILHEDLTLNIKNKDKKECKEVFKQLCITIGNLDVLIKMVSQYEKRNNKEFEKITVSTKGKLKSGMSEMGYKINKK